LFRLRSFPLVGNGNAADRKIREGDFDENYMSTFGLGARLFDHRLRDTLDKLAFLLD